MKKILSTSLFTLVTAICFSQKVTFDLVSYIEPKGWKKEMSESTTSYTNVNNKTKSWCRISIVKSTSSKGNINDDFDNEWKEMVVASFHPISAPEVNDMQEMNGWKVKAGGAKFIFNNENALVYMTTATGFGRCATIVATTNTADYVTHIDSLLSSVTLLKPASAQVPTPGLNSDRKSLAGTWCITASDQSSYKVKNGIVSTIYRQYTFNANGTYTCNIKTFDPLLPSILLGREKGGYEVKDNKLTITPKSSVLEEWSKKNNADQWGTLLKSQNVSLEKVEYSFVQKFIPEINEWQLILTAGKTTRRDGPFNNYEKNAWIYILSSPARPVMKLPAGN